MVISCKLPFGIGNDIAQSSRFLRHDSVALHKLIRRVLHPREIKIAQSRFPTCFETRMDATRTSLKSLPIEYQRLSGFLAGRWAAKEAAKKAWGADVLGFRDIQVLSHTEFGSKPYVLCDPLIDEGDVGDSEPSEHAQTGLLSISHDGDYAMATVIAEPLNSSLTEMLLQRKQSVFTASVTESSFGS